MPNTEEIMMSVITRCIDVKCPVGGREASLLISEIFLKSALSPLSGFLSPSRMFFKSLIQGQVRFRTGVAVV